MLYTPRLILRQWRDSDLDIHGVMNADPRVMEFMPTCLTQEESDAAAARARAHIDEHGWGVWAVELPGLSHFIGSVGLSRPRFESHFTPCVEILWRIRRDHWGYGYATEAAQAVLAYGYGTLKLPEIFSFTVPDNRRSIRVMERIGLKRDVHGDFDHPFLPVGHPLRRHVLYRGRAPSPM